MNYEPRPDTVCFRALAHMELLHKGSEISTGTLATAIGVDSNGLATQLTRAAEAGLLYMRQKGGHIRSPKFWSLVDRSKDAHAAPPPGPQTPIQKVQPNAATSEDDEDDGAPKQLVTKAQPGATDLQIRETVQTNRETNPLQGVWSAGINIDDVHRTRDRVIEMDTPPPKASTEAAQVDGKDSSEDHAEQRSREDTHCQHGQRLELRCMLCDFANVPALRAPPKPAPEPEVVVRQLTPDNAADIRIALWSDGTLEIRAFEAPTMLLTRNQARQLVDYLNAIDLDVLEEDEAA